MGYSFHITHFVSWNIVAYQNDTPEVRSSKTLLSFQHVYLNVGSSVSFFTEFIFTSAEQERLQRYIVIVLNGIPMD